MSVAVVDAGGAGPARGSRAEALVVLGQLSAELADDLAAWSARAACRGVGLAGFFGGASLAERTAFCQCCPVTEACLWWVMVVEEDSGCRFGIWGGTTPAVRGRMARAAGAGYARRRLQAALAALAPSGSGERCRTGGRR